MDQRSLPYTAELHEYVDPKILGQRFYSRDDPKTEISEDWQLMHKVCNVLGLQHGIHYSEAIFTMGNDIWNAKKRPAVAPGNLPGEIMVLTDIRFDQQENKLLLSYYEYTVDDYWKTDVRLVNKLGCAVSKKIITTN